MTVRRRLGDLLGDLANGAAAFAGGNGMSARSISISLPIDLRLVETSAGPEIIGDAPLFITRTDFDPDPARLSVEWHAVPTPPAGARS